MAWSISRTRTTGTGRSMCEPFFIRAKFTPNNNSDKRPTLFPLKRAPASQKCRLWGAPSESITGASRRLGPLASRTADCTHSAYSLHCALCAVCCPMCCVRPILQPMCSRPLVLVRWDALGRPPSLSARRPRSTRATKGPPMIIMGAIFLHLSPQTTDTPPVRPAARGTHSSGGPLAQDCTGAPLARWAL